MIQDNQVTKRKKSSGNGIFIVIGLIIFLVVVPVVVFSVMAR